MRDLVDAIRPLLNSVMSDIGVQESDWNNLLASSTDSAFADVAMPCHSLSKVLRKAPNTIRDAVLFGSTAMSRPQASALTRQIGSQQEVPALWKAWSRSFGHFFGHICGTSAEPMGY